jgi:hypothetical protein
MDVAFESVYAALDVDDNVDYDHHVAVVCS